MKFSVIVITYNEEEKIGDVINSILDASKGHDCEIILSDGGSCDNTLLIAHESGIRSVKSEPCRGIQCNNGAENSSGDILVFLHGDTIFPEEGFDVLANDFKNPDCKIGTLKMGFDEPHFLLKFYTFFTSFDSIFTSFGDQCIAVRKSYFYEIGRFPNWQLFEDVHFLRTARKQTKIHSFNSKVITSARRFKKNGIIKQQLRNASYILLYLAGISSKKLSELYSRQSIQKRQKGIIIFAKYPEPGKVKTRLAASIGKEKAAEFYDNCAKKTKKECLKIVDLERYFFFAESKNYEKVMEWIGNGFHFYAQSNGNLGDRIKAAFQVVFKEGNDKVIIIGTDCPDLNNKKLEKAYKELKTNDVVIGPAADGGYYLIGTSKFYPELFENIDWSTDRVFEQTIRNIEKLGLKSSKLEELRDIDTIEDLRNWMGKQSEDNPIQKWIEEQIYYQY